MAQTSGNVMAAIMRETTAGTPAGPGAGAQQLRIVDSPGLRLDRGVIESNERRRDMLRNMGRLGGRTVGGSYNAELTLGGVTDMLFESILRSTWQPAQVITQTTAGLTSITTTASTIVAGGGSWITAGVRIGDIVTLTEHSAAENNHKRLRVTNVTATTITVAGTPLTASATADNSFTLTVLKKLTTSSLPTRYSHTIEQYDGDIDRSELFVGCRLTGLSLSFRPNAIATVTYTFMGRNRQIVEQAQAPWFTSPSLTSGVPLIADDSVIRAYGQDFATFTGLDLNFEIAAAVQPVIGSFVSPDVFDNQLTISGSITGLREDFSRIEMFEAETEFEVSMLFFEPESDPADCIGIYLPRVKFGSVDAPFLGGDGAKIETVPIMVAPHQGGTGRDASAVNIYSTSAP